MIVTDASWIGSWVCEGTGGKWIDGRGTALGLMNKEGGLKAGVLYEDWNGANIVCHIRGEEGWATREFLRVIFDYPFRQLGVKRITVPVASTNERCLRFVRHLGFELEATLKDAHPDGDIQVFKITPDKCRWLKRG